MKSAVQQAMNASLSEETKLMWLYMLELLKNFYPL
jgi:hypothetical protein